MAAVDEAAGLLRERIGELDDERKKLDGALRALTDGGRPRARGTRRRRRRTTATRGRAASARAPRGRRRRQLLSRIESHPQARLADHAKAIGVSDNHASSLVRQLLDSGDVVKPGRGRYAVNAT